MEITESCVNSANEYLLAELVIVCIITCKNYGCVLIV